VQIRWEISRPIGTSSAASQGKRHRKASGIARQAASQGKRHRKASGIASGIVRPVAVR